MLGAHPSPVAQQQRCTTFQDTHRLEPVIAGEERQVWIVVTGLGSH